MRRSIRIMMAILYVLCFCFVSSSCWLWGGFNQIMYEYFKDESNYHEWTMTVSDFVWIDNYKGRTVYSLYESSTQYEYKALEKMKYDDIYLYLCVSDADKAAYWGENCEKVAFELFYTNAQTIIENGALENIRLGDTVTIKATDWTYSDGRFLYIAYLESNSVCYLDFETGLNNIVTYMDENRSLL